MTVLRRDGEMENGEGGAGAARVAMGLQMAGTVLREREMRDGREDGDGKRG